MFSIYIFLFVVVNATQQNIIYIMAVLMVVKVTGPTEEKTKLKMQHENGKNDGIDVH
jgi:hypothetical protein